MTADSSCQWTSNAAQVPVEPVLRAILDKLESIDQTLKNIESMAKKSPGKRTEFLSVNDMIAAMQMKYPGKVWTADELAEKIGCTGSAVRKTKAWKICQGIQKNEQHEHPKPKGYKDKRGRLEAFAPDNGEDVVEHET